MRQWPEWVYVQRTEGLSRGTPSCVRVRDGFTKGLFWKTPPPPSSGKVTVLQWQRDCVQHLIACVRISDVLLAV